MLALNRLIKLTNVRPLPGFEGRLARFRGEVGAFVRLGNLEKVAENIVKVDALQQKLEAAMGTVKNFSDREKLFGRKVTEYKSLSLLMADFEPYATLWKVAAEWTEYEAMWYNGPFEEIDRWVVGGEVLGGRGGERDRLRGRREGGEREREREREKERERDHPKDSSPPMPCRFAPYPSPCPPPQTLHSDQFKALPQKWIAKLQKALRVFTAMPAPLKVAKILKSHIAGFMEYTPLIEHLRSPALKDRHWEKISRRVGAKLHPEEGATLHMLIESGTVKQMEYISTLCAEADKEYKIEENVTKMQNAWNEIELLLAPHKDTGTYILKSSDELFELLDDHLMKTQTIKCSPHVRPIEDEVLFWEKQLKNGVRLFEEWLSTQKTWLYLEPIFASEDIMRQLPTEGRRFKDVDSQWRVTMEKTKLQPTAMDIIGREGLHSIFVDMNRRLELILKGLTDYLETKRLVFPRFFFLSNDELLEILSQTKDPQAVQVHLPKCFEGINHLLFDDDERITAMVSSRGEHVSLEDAVDPGESEDADSSLYHRCHCRLTLPLALTRAISPSRPTSAASGANMGNVENWLLDVESQMRATMRTRLHQCHQASASTQRTEWIFQWPAQAVLGVGTLLWTSAVEKVLRMTEPKPEPITPMQKRMSSRRHLGTTVNSRSRASSSALSRESSRRQVG